MTLQTSQFQIQVDFYPSIYRFSNQVLFDFVYAINNLIEMNQPMMEAQDKMLDSTSALEKVLRLDRKHTNFDYHDPLRNLTLRINYPQVAPEGPASDTLLKSLWRHLANYYFKPIQESQLQRLYYIGSVLRSYHEGVYRFEQSEQFWVAVEGLFSHAYLHRYLLGEEECYSLHNSLQMMHIVWQISLERDPKRQKTMQQAYNQTVQDIKRNWIYFSSSTSLQKLEMECRRIQDEIIQPADPEDEINFEILRYEEELLEVQQEVESLCRKLEERVEAEISLQEVVFCSAGEEEPEQILEEGESRAERRLAKMQSFDMQTRYIQYTIRQLERKQIAESVSKLQRVERNKGETKMQMVFEEAMGIKPITVSQQKFKQINSLRQYSLLKFYNTASKSIYSFVCQNYLGFRDIYEHRNRPCRLKDKDILAEMKRTAPDPLSAAYYKEFGRMEICHHCKLLQPESALVKCEYRSSRFGTPVPPSPYYDSYIHQILKNEQSRISAIRFLNSSDNRRNSFFHYLKKDDQYVCERKYCRYCLKNYEQNKDKAGGLCPYCRGICYCTRCSRNDTIVRLKSMFVLLGGDINQLQRDSYFQQYYSQSEDAIALRRKEKMHKNGRRIHSAPNRQNQKMINIRFQLQDLRLVCDLVKRREKNKQKLMTCMKQAFRAKVKLICPDFNFIGLQGKPVQAANAPVLDEKLSKKLKRMIC